MEGKTFLEKFNNLAKLSHKDQAIWCLNALWNQHKDKAENFWQWTNKFIEFDIQRVGNVLDELNCHRVYESFNNTHTVRELRDKLREIGYQPRPMMFPISCYIILELNADWKIVVNATPGSSEELEKAKKMVEEARQRLEAALAAEKEAIAKESELKAAKAEAAAALAEVKAQEEARERRTQDLTEKSQGTGVKAGMAKQELAQHLAADPLPLRKAKITLEAANRKLEKAVIAAEKARADAEAAAEAARKSLDAAEAYLREVSSKSSSAEGTIWFLEREAKFLRQFLPSSKGGVSKK